MKSKHLLINGKKVGPGCPVYIIAEMGINHNGRLSTALKMVDVAKKSGVDAVKIQIVYAAKSYVKNTESYKIFKDVELSLKNWQTIISRAKNYGLDIFASFPCPQDVYLSKEFDLAANKVSSSNVTNFPLLKAMAKIKKPILMSCGLSTIKEVTEAVAYLTKHGNRELAILQCTALYPTPYEDVNLNTIKGLQEKYGRPVGFSDHSNGIHCAVAAVALGACIIEKHYTLDPTMAGPDHHFSSSPKELTEMVRAIRNVEQAMGTFDKKPVAQEIEKRKTLQRVIVAAKDIKKNEDSSRFFKKESKKDD